MNLPKSLAKTVMDYINQQFWEYYPGSTDNKLYQHLYHNQLTGKFSISWCEGGTAGDCWSDELTEIEAEHEPEMGKLLSFLSKYYPDLDKKEIDEILNMATKTTEYDSDWYGGETSQATKNIYFNQVMYKLIELKHFNDTEYINTDTLIDYVKELVRDQSLHDYNQVKKMVNNKIDNLEVKKSLRF